MLGESETFTIDSQFHLLHTEGLVIFDIKDKDDKLNRCTLYYRYGEKCLLNAPTYFKKKLNVFKTYIVFVLNLFACVVAARISSRALY
jgi:hypothetical protein